MELWGRGERAANGDERAANARATAGAPMLSSASMALRLQAIVGEELYAEWPLSPGTHAVGRGQDADLALPSKGFPDLLCRLEVTPSLGVTVFALGEGDVETSGGKVLASAPLRRGDFVTLGGLRLLLFEQAGEPALPFVRRARALTPTSEAEAILSPYFGPMVAHVKVPGGSAMEPVLGPVTLVGRDPKVCQIVLPYGPISEQHFRFQEKPDGFWVEDLGSTNGTFVNGRKVTALRVAPGDVVTCGPQKGAPELWLLRPEDALARPPDDDPVARLVGDSRPMKRLKERLRRYGPLHDPVLILGETGTGKQLAAEALSEMRDGPGALVVFDCGGTVESLIESALFGHVKGAFTGALHDQMGRFEEANGKTLFLDEVGELTLSAQTRLLRVLQEEKIRRVGGSHEIPVHVRVVSATHRDLPRLVKEGRFREDLFMRLHVLAVQMPALRERHGDLGLLARAILGRLGGRQKEKLLSERAMEKLASHSWPGNVRELQTTLRRAAADAEGQEIDAADVTFATRPAEDEEAGGLPSLPLEAEIAARERAACEAALRKSEGNVAQAARLLGLNESKLRRMLKRMGLIP